MRVYGAAAYRAGFSLMLVWSALAVALILLTRDTRLVEGDRAGAA